MAEVAQQRQVAAEILVMLIRHLQSQDKESQK
jgi:hypothetical protein